MCPGGHIQSCSSVLTKVIIMDSPKADQCNSSYRGHINPGINTGVLWDRLEPGAVGNILHIRKPTRPVEIHILRQTEVKLLVYYAKSLFNARWPFNNKKPYVWLLQKYRFHSSTIEWDFDCPFQVVWLMSYFLTFTHFNYVQKIISAMDPWTIIWHKACKPVICKNLIGK